MSDSCIGFIDSGIGGVPYLRWTRDRLPGERYVYVADTVNFPYGDKSADSIKKTVVDLVGRLTGRFECKLVVVACNTASVVALSALRETFSLPFVGVVPAVKPAAENSHDKRIGVIATNRTVFDVYTDTLIHEFASHCTVIRNSGSALVDFVEDRLLSASEAEKIRVVEETVEVFKDARIDTIVLGCTHFVLLESYFRRVLGDNIRVVDSREGVGNRIRSLLEQGETNRPPDAEKAVGEDNGVYNGKKGEALFFITGGNPCNGKYKAIAEHFKVHFGGVL